jgi:hypothetical protein
MLLSGLALLGIHFTQITPDNRLWQLCVFNVYFYRCEEKGIKS